MNFKWLIISLFLMILTACGADPSPQKPTDLQENLSKNPSSGPVSEGQTVIFSLTTNNASANTSIPFTISGEGITVNDIESMKLNGVAVPVALTGNFIIGQEGTANYASLSLEIKSDFTTEGTEILTVSSGNRLSSSVSISILDKSLADTTPPQIIITGAGPVSTTGSTVITGTVSDNVTVSSVSWTNNLGGSGSATVIGNTWTATVALSIGNNTITFTSIDSANNKTSINTLIARELPLDTTNPIITIIGQPTVTSDGKLSLNGIAADDIEVKFVTWSLPGGGAGAAVLAVSGKSVTWQINDIQLQLGSNIITVVATDSSGNKSNSSITVNRADVTSPTIGITNQGPMNTDYTVTIIGTANDDVGVANIFWSNGVGGNGFATITGTTSATWTATIPLNIGSNALSFMVSDSAGNSNFLRITINRTPPPDTTPPTISITLVGTMDATGVIKIDGIASDASGVQSVAWINDQGGAGAATVTGTTDVTWYVTNIQLKTGPNIITFTASDTLANNTRIQVTVDGPASSGSTSFVKAKRTPRPIAKIEPEKTIPEIVKVLGPAVPPRIPDCEIQMNRLMEQCRAQMMSPFQFTPQELLPEFRGVYSEKVIELSIPDPPEELHHCNLSMKIPSSQMPTLLKEHTVNDWWLMASFSGYELYSNSQPGTAQMVPSNRTNSREEAYFYWARLLSENEIGVVPTGFKTKDIIKNKLSIDVQIDTGLATLPYYWIAQFWGEQLPRSEEEPCRSNR